MKALSLVASIIATGTHGLTDEQKQRIRINNALCLTTGVLAIVMGFIFWAVTDRLQILVPAIIDGLGFFFIIYLNHLKKHEAAAICMIGYHALWVVYFGALLGGREEVVLALLFMISATYIVFNRRKSILICFCITLAGLFVTEFFYYSRIIEPIPLSHNVAFFIRWMCIAFILTLNTVCILFYKNTVGRLMEALKERSAQLEKANHARKIFLQETSHEIRNPLNAVFGIVQLMRLDLKNGRTQESLPALVDNLYVATFNVKDIINNVLELSRIEAGQLDEVNRKHVHIRHLLQGIAGIYEYVAVTKSVELKLHFNDSMPDIVFTDDTKLSQIVNNLLLNAIKYTRNQSVITIDCGVRDDRWYIGITDQGGGLEAEKLRAIFHCLHADRNSFMEGTGLGLHISRHFAELLNGGITVASLEGISTTFTVSFPAKDIVSRHTPSAQRAAPAPRQFAGKRILVVEDDKMNQAILRNFLQNNGATVTLAANGIEGLEEARAGAPHLIILDSHMPKMNGREMLFHLKQDEALRHIPVVIASGDAFTETAALFMREGASDYVIKPIEFTALRQVLDKHLNNSLLVNEASV